MDALVELSWRAYPASVLMILGAWLALRGGRGYVVGTRLPLTDRWKSLVTMQGFRLTIIGLALAGAGAAWLWQLGWLLALSLAIGGEETLECSICVYALRRAPKVEAAFKQRRAARPAP